MRPQAMMLRLITQGILRFCAQIVVKILIFLQILHRTGKRVMRLVIGNHHQEGFVITRWLMEEIDRPVADTMRPGEGFVDIVDQQILHAVQAVTPQTDLFFRQFREVISPVIPVVGIPLGWTLAGTKVIMPVEMPLTDVAGVVARILEVAPHGGNVFPRCDVIGPRAGLVGINTGKQPRAGRGAYR